MFELCCKLSPSLGSCGTPHPHHIPPRSCPVRKQILTSPLLHVSDPGYPQLCEAICLLFQRLVHQKTTHALVLLYFL